MSRINVMKPWLGQDEIDAVALAIRSGWVAQGPRVAEFETLFAREHGAHHGVAVSSCTAALHLSLVVCGIAPGDEVIVPSLSFIATANAVRYVGAQPVFADVDPVTGNLTAASIAAVITGKTRAVIVVDQGGVPADLDSIRDVTDSSGLVIIEDAACGVGSTYQGKPVGVGADITAWSFHPRKVMTTGEGGMVTTDRADWAARVRLLREHAMSVSASDRHASVFASAEEYVEVGYNYRMTDLQAAVGLVQLAKLPEIIRRRREIAAAYTAALQDVPGLRLVADPPWGESNFQSFWVEIEPSSAVERDTVLHRLAEADISARRGIMAIHRQPAYRGDPGIRGPLPVTECLSDNTLILPVFQEITDAEQSRVVDVLSRAVRQYTWAS